MNLRNLFGRTHKKLYAEMLKRKLLLAFAIDQCDFSWVEKQLKQGTRPDAEHVLAAVRNGDADVVDVLLKYNADPQGTDEKGNTALHLAAGNNAAVIVKRLLQEDIFPDAFNEEGRTPLMEAAKAGANRSIRLLATKSGVGFNTRAERFPYWKAMEFAAEEGHQKTVELLQELRNERIKKEDAHVNEQCQTVIRRSLLKKDFSPISDNRAKASIQK